MFSLLINFMKILFFFILYILIWDNFIKIGNIYYFIEYCLILINR